jgi:hypothetical protein
VAVVALLVLAGGLAVAIALTNSGGNDAKKTGEGTTPAPSAPVQNGTQLDETFAPPTGPTITQRPVFPNGTPRKNSKPPSAKPSSTKPSPSATPSTTPTAPATTPPTTEPTTPPPTEPTTPPPTEPTPTEGTGGDGGGDDPGTGA